MRKTRAFSGYTIRRPAHGAPRNALVGAGWAGTLGTSAARGARPAGRGQQVGQFPAEGDREGWGVPGQVPPRAGLPRVGDAWQRLHARGRLPVAISSP